MTDIAAKPQPSADGTDPMTPPDPPAPEEARNAGLTVSPFQSFLGYEVERWDSGRTELSLLIRPHHLNRSGILHGGVMMTLLDTASGLAAGHIAGGSAPQPTVTISLTCNFIASEHQGRLLAVGRVEGRGRRVVSTSATLHAEDGRLLATAIGSFRTFGPPAGEPEVTPR